MGVLDALGDHEAPERLLVPELRRLRVLERARVTLGDVDLARDPPLAQQRGHLGLATPGFLERGHVGVAVGEQLLHGAEQHGVQHRPAAERRVLDPVLGDAHLIERRVRPLQGLGDHAHVVEREEAPRVAEALFGPRAAHDLDGLVEALAALLLGHAVSGELGRAVAPPHAHVEPAVRDDVDEGHLLGEAQRVMEGQDRRGEADAHPARPGRRRRRERRGIHRQPVVDEVVLREPDLVEPELLGPLDLLELAVDDVGVPLARRRLEEVEGAETHHATPR